MFKSKAKIKGQVTVQVFGPDGKLKRYEPNWFQKLLGLPGREMKMTNHNIVTNRGDALIADLMATTPVQTKVNNASGVIGVGTGFSAEVKTVTALVTQVGSNEAMDATYPKIKGAFDAADDNVTQYRSTFEAGDLNSAGIDEAALGNGTYLLAYAEITPAITVTTADTLQVDWELTFLGS